MIDENSYLHGFSKQEQQRLINQARFAANSVYSDVHFSPNAQVLELGAGVGAQTELLLARFATISLTATDISQEQLQVLQQRLLPHPRLTVSQQDANQLSYCDNSFDNVFWCWLLEHVPNPLSVLEQAKRVLKPKGQLICNEVLNASFMFYPHFAGITAYWQAFNQLQLALGGDPNVGVKLGNLLHQAGFNKVTLTSKTWHLDSRHPHNCSAYFKYWHQLLLSAAPKLLEKGYFTRTELNQIRKEMTQLEHAENAIFYYSFVQAHASID